MPRGCDHAVHVRLNDRHFIVEYDADGNVLRIKERKLYEAGKPWEHLYNASWWVATSHPLGNGDTLPKRVIAAAAVLAAAEDRAADATP